MKKEKLFITSLILASLSFSTGCGPLDLLISPDDTENPGLSDTAISSTQGKIIYGYGDKVKEYDINLQSEKVLFEGDQPDLAPNGDIIYINRTFPGQNLILKAMNPTYTSARVIFDGRDKLGGSIYDPQVSPDGNAVAMTITSWDSSSYEYKSDGVLVLGMDGQFRALFKDKYTPSWTPDGRLVMAGSFGTNRLNGQPGASKTPGLFISDQDLKILTRIDPDLNDPVPHQPAVSPDGKKVAFVLNAHIWVMDINGKELKQLTGVDNDNQESYPAWSPDSKSIAFWSFKTFERSYYTAIAKVPADAASPIVLSNDSQAWALDSESSRVSGGSKQLSWR